MKPSESQVQAFQDGGYLVVETVVTDADMAPVIAEYKRWTGRRAQALPEITPRAVPVGKGGFVFMHRWTPHRSTPNFSSAVRWGLDQGAGKRGQSPGAPHQIVGYFSRSNMQQHKEHHITL